MSIQYAMCVPHPPLIIPEIGKGEEKTISNTIQSYESIMKYVSALPIETVIVISPHAIAYSDYIHISPGKHASGDFSQFGVGDVRIEVNYDSELVKKITQSTKKNHIFAGTLGKDDDLDHGTMIPLYFLNKYFKDYKVVRIGISGLSPLTHYRFGQCIKEAAGDKNVLLIASGDLSHCLKEDGPYGYKEEGPLFDYDIITAWKNSDFMRFLTFDPHFIEAASECGLRSFQIMSGALDRKKVKPHYYSYEGPFGVGYGICGFEICGDDFSRDIGNQYEKKMQEEVKKIKEHEDDYVKLARTTIEHYVKEKVEIIPEVTEEMKRRAGVFVSIHEEGRLRGCIGTFMPVQDNIALEIVHNAISACSEDPRFDPITEEELDNLIISVDVLGELELVEDISTLDPRIYGIIVSHGSKRGLLLPDLEGVDTVTDQIQIACHKAGIHEGEKIKIERFKVIRHG